VCLELTDHTSREKSALEFFASNDPAQAARLADQFIQQNRPVLDLLNVSIHRDFDGRDVRLRIQSGSAVGAVPLRSPRSGKPDFGLVVQPRFPWSGIGPMLSEMGWLITPAPLRLPLLRRSERRVPPWVLSVMVLARLRELLDRLERRFEMTEESRNAPKGRVDWQAYANRSMPRAQFLTVPCTFPDLSDDRLLKGAHPHDGIVYFRTGGTEGDLNVVEAGLNQGLGVGGVGQTASVAVHAHNMPFLVGVADDLGQIGVHGGFATGQNEVGDAYVVEDVDYLEPAASS